MVHSKDQGTLSFQHYFVRDRCAPEVTGFNFSGIESASMSDGFAEVLDVDQNLDAVFVCPSNPFVSVDPILSLPGVLDALRARNIPVVVVSNIVGGEALKGPAAKMMTELGMPQTALGVARHYADRYGDLITGFVLDDLDFGLQADVESLGFKCIVTNTVMDSLQVKTALAKTVVEFASALARP